MGGFKCCQKIPVKECIYSKVAGYRPATLQGCFTFQWRGGVFFRRGASFLSGGCTPWRRHRFWWEGILKKIIGWGGEGAPPCPPPTMGNPECCPHIESSQLICYENQLTGFCMRATLAYNGLKHVYCCKRMLLFTWQITSPFQTNKLNLNKGCLRGTKNRLSRVLKIYLKRGWCQSYLGQRILLLGFFERANPHFHAKILPNEGEKAFKGAFSK